MTILNQAPASEPEFQQAYNELESTLRNSSLFQKNPEYQTALKVVALPERVIQFRVIWEDDTGNTQANTGYRVQFNSALGPYKGGLRFHPSVNLSILKFLGFEQIFKNALTGLSLGGGKGGSDFDPKGKTDNEIRRFCYAFMAELSKHIGPDTDVPAGDIGVGAREIGFLFGAYKKQRDQWAGVLTGKGVSWGGSKVRPEATGYGLVYYVGHMLKFLHKDTLDGKRVVISGSGNVAQFAARKCIENGAVVLSLSDSKGALLAEDDTGFTPADIDAIASLKLSHQALSVFEAGSRFKWVPNARPWTMVKSVDIALPCATQNEVSGEEAKTLLKDGCFLVAEGSNMGCTQDAIDVFENSRREAGIAGLRNGQGAIWYAPGKASNCGGVAVSGLEMAQNSQRLSWSEEEVDKKLRGIMANVFDAGLTTATEYVPSQPMELPSLVAGSNIAGFVKVAKAMRDHGDWWASSTYRN